MIAYSTPFLGAFMADVLWGDYITTLFGLFVFTIPGVLLLALTTIPHFLGEEFHESLLKIGVLFLWPLGTGVIKSTINVFGAKQHHPVLQSTLIGSYYVNFYMCINIGALAGIAIIPILAQQNVAMAYFIPLVLLGCGGLVFFLGTPLYVRPPPAGKLGGNTARNTSSRMPLQRIFCICSLIVPFCVGYNQMPTTFIVQGTVMNKAFGFLDVASMNCLDAISVLVFGYLTANYLYPWLAHRGIKIPTTYKFAIGSGLGALAIVWSLVVEHMIHAAYEKDGSKINVLWQAPAYLLVGWGEIFAVSTSYEVAFTASSPDQKVFASATNIFCVGGLPNLLCIVLYRACSVWFQNSHGSTKIDRIEDYATAKVSNYFMVLLGILLLGVVINVQNGVRDFVSNAEAQAAEMVRTPALRKAKLSRRGDESSPLLTPKSARYQKYVGQAPVLYKMGSMRAGTSLGQKSLIQPSKPIKYGKMPKIAASQEKDSNSTMNLGRLNSA
eukprot:CAMPEP_0172471430 /NCGR_PEP_ID=MMETSP1065-20121228/67812_1 /TAXON_ID=265537 /ORGANISM="Amphiprora paludosa, Strain CCMP125" /LENGTH=496 /DNA_ID=CAMNT_0013229525 /DNA_START=561 /DNA_END=2051 /DNA_ORIENTATION=-